MISNPCTPGDFLRNIDEHANDTRPGVTDIVRMERSREELRRWREIYSMTFDEEVKECLRRR